LVKAKNNAITGYKRGVWIWLMRYNKTVISYKGIKQAYNRGVNLWEAPMC